MRTHDYKRQIWQSAWYKKNSLGRRFSNTEASGEEQLLKSPEKIELPAGNPKIIRWQPQYVWSNS